MGQPRVLLTQRLGHTWSKARRDVNWFILKNKQQLITSVGLYCSKRFKAHSTVVELCKFVFLKKPCCLEGLFLCGGQAGVSPAWHCFQGTQKLLPLALQEGWRLQQPTWTCEIPSGFVLVFIVWFGTQCLNPSGIQFPDSFWTSVWQWIQCWINEFLPTYLVESRP